MGIGYVLLDGAADRKDERLNNTTPLHAAITDHLDRIVSRGSLGYVYTVGKGIAPESDVAVLSMLGYNFGKNYPGRGVIEAIGSGMDFRDGMLAMRANFASVKDGYIIDRRAGRNITEEELKELEKEVSSVKIEGADIQFKGTVGHRGVLLIRAERPLSSEITNTDPAYKVLKGFGVATKVSGKMRVEKSKPLTKEKGAVLAARLVNEFTEKVMAHLSRCNVNVKREKEGKLPANCILLRDAGCRIPRVEPFEKKYGIKAKAVVDMPVEIGIAKIVGMEIVNCRERSLEERAEIFVSSLQNECLVYLHIKGPDEFGHDGDLFGKKRSIEKIDMEFFKYLRDLSSRLVVSCDHATPCKMMMHSSDPVPILVTGVDGCKAPRFAEVYAKKRLLGIVRGRDVLHRVLRLERGN